MTKEEFKAIQSIIDNQTAARYLICGEIKDHCICDGISKDFCNRLYRNDPDFRADLIALQNKYIQKYEEQFAQIQITQLFLEP